MAESKGFFRRIFSFGTSDRPEAERTPEHGQTPIPNDMPEIVTPGAPDADVHSPAAASTVADSEAGAQPDDGGGITPLTPKSSTETAEKKTLN